MKKEPSELSYHEWVKFKTGLALDETECPECKRKYDKMLNECPWCKQEKIDADRQQKNN